jgi:hypothetical protein
MFGGFPKVCRVNFKTFFQQKNANFEENTNLINRDIISGNPHEKFQKKSRRNFEHLRAKFKLWEEIIRRSNKVQSIQTKKID